MTFDDWLPLLTLLTSLLPGIVIFVLPEERVRWRTTLNLGGSILKLALIGVMIWGVHHEHVYETRLPILPDIDLVLNADAMSVMMTALSGVLWFLTTLYAIAYLETSSQSRSRFFGFFSLCVSSTTGIALAGNLMTFLMFYEMLTLSTYPLVVYRGTPESMRAGRIYIVYTFGGGAAFLIGVAWLKALVGSVAFTEGGMLAPYVDAYATQLQFIFFLMIAGLGVKAALVPLHGWLPQAMVAPAPGKPPNRPDITLPTPWPMSSLSELCCERVRLSAMTEVSRASMHPSSPSTMASTSMICHSAMSNTGMASSGRPVGISPIRRMSAEPKTNTDTRVPRIRATSWGGR